MHSVEHLGGAVEEEQEASDEKMQSQIRKMSQEWKLSEKRFTADEGNTKDKWLWNAKDTQQALLQGKFQFWYFQNFTGSWVGQISITLKKMHKEFSDK